MLEIEWRWPFCQAIYKFYRWWHTVTMLMDGKFGRNKWSWNCVSLEWHQFFKCFILSPLCRANAMQFPFSALLTFKSCFGIEFHRWKCIFHHQQQQKQQQKEPHHGVNPQADIYVMLQFRKKSVSLSHFNAFPSSTTVQCYAVKSSLFFSLLTLPSHHTIERCCLNVDIMIYLLP